MDKKKEYSPKVGEFVSLDKCTKWRKKYAHNHAQKEKGKFIGAYFFGKENIQNLIDHKNAVGIRIYFGVDEVDDKKLIIFPVDQDGKDIYIKSSETDVNTEEIDISKDEELGGLDGGLPCPPYCP